MPTLTIDVTDLPKAQFTAGSLLKRYAGAKLAEVRQALDGLVDAGQLTVKVAGSGARNYKVVAAKATKATKATRTETATDPAPVASADRAERLKMAKQESETLKAWQRDPQGPQPATPNLDAVNTKQPTARKAKSDSTSTPRGTTVQFVVDGKPMPASQNKLSSVAWAHTKGVGGETVARIDVKALRQLFADAGVADPSNTVGVNVTLPNGKVVTTTAV